MFKPLSIRATQNYHIYIRFSDGEEGEVDISDLVGQGVFKAWEDYSFFEKIHIGPGRQIRWSEEIELCPDTIYMMLTGKTREELFPRLKREMAHA